MVDFAKMRKDAQKRKENMVDDKVPGKTTIRSGDSVTTHQREVISSFQPKDGEQETSSGTEVAVVKTSQVAEKFFAPDEIEEMAGMGQENVKVTDTLLPRLAILQSLSPQLKKSKVEFIEGASAGDWCDVSVGEVFKDQIEVIPCHFCTQYIQWKKNRGGFAGNLGADASVLRDTTLNEKRQNILPNGDTIAETAHWYVLLHVGYEWRRAFLPFSSTGLKVSRKWHSLIRAERLLGQHGLFIPPLFYRSWTLKVAQESNDQGDWYLPNPMKTERDPADITDASPEKYKNIYHLMAEMDDTGKWLLNEAKKFYIDARDNLVIGDLGAEDTNDPANARVVGAGSSIDDNSRSM